MPAAAGPLTNIPIMEVVAFTVVTVVVAFVEQVAMEMGRPWIELPMVNPLVLLQATVVVALSVQFVALLAAKFSNICVYHAMPPSGEIWKVQPLFEYRSALRT